MNKFIYLTFIVLLIVHSLGYANDRTLPTIKLAVVGPLNGIYSAYGTQILSGAMQAANDINNAGGIKGLLIEILPFDDQCNPDLAIKQAEEIIQNKNINAVIGHVCSSATLAASNIYARANMLLITPTATNDKITSRNISTLFRMSGTDQQQSATAAKFIAKTLKSKRIAILHDQDLYSKDLADSVSENLLHLDVVPILYQGIARGTRNFTPIIKKLKALNADAIYFAGLYPEIGHLAKALNVLQLQIPLITGDGAAVNKLINVVGNSGNSNSIILVFSDNPQDLVSSKAVINTMQKNHQETTGYVLYSYAAVQVIAKAIEVANTTDNVTLANWLHQHQVETILGKKSWDTNGNIIDSKFNVCILQNENNLVAVAKP